MLTATTKWREIVEIWKKIYFQSHIVDDEQRQQQQRDDDRLIDIDPDIGDRRYLRRKNTVWKSAIPVGRLENATSESGRAAVA